MTCKKVVEFLDRYVDRDLRSDARRSFEEHLAGCEHCARYLKSYRAASELAARAMKHPEDSPPAEVPEQLLHAVLAARRLLPR